jgi:hypothetical protein
MTFLVEVVVNRYLLTPLFLRFEDQGGAVMACG